MALRLYLQVIFARAQPSMENRMVTEVMSRYPDQVSLAVGDGANDTEMIQAAHIGVSFLRLGVLARSELIMVGCSCCRWALRTWRALQPPTTPSAPSMCCIP